MSGASYTYSAMGERLTKANGAGQTRYGYDGRGNLSSVELPGGVRADYDLDAYGRRITKRRNGTVQNRFLYRNALQPAADVDASGAVISRYVYGAGGLAPDAIVRAGTTYMLVKDERGSVRFVVDGSTGAVAQGLEYDAFGRVLSDSNPGFQPFGYGGGLYDADTGLVHLGAREYDPETGSFTRKDPSRFGGGENQYAYCAGDPVNLVDWDGENPILIAAGEGAIISYADEGGSQMLDPNFAGFDCGALRGAAAEGAIFGALGAAVGGAKGRQCFAAGTEVATADGPKPIESVAVGDRVLSRDEATGEQGYARVTQVFQHAAAEQLALTFTDAHGATTSLVTTPEHPFRAANGRWVPAGRLEIGANVVTAEGALATLSAALSLAQRGEVYNFEVEGTHTYFVGAAKVWVHNSCRETGGRPGEYLGAKAPKQVSPGTRVLEGQHVNNLGRVEPWAAHYDDYGRLVARTDYNAGNVAQGIPDVHHHVYEYNDAYPLGREAVSHAPGEFKWPP
ncbi:MAG: repeat protein [Labilithrix sp.]|nr:repeat protein [Labilithrix sp.]